MRNVIQKAYHIFWSIFALLFLWLFFSFRLDVSQERGAEGFDVLTDYEMETDLYGNSPVGIRQLYSFTLDGVEGAYCQLMFYSIHQNVRVYLEDECIYSMKGTETDVSGKSPGCVWNMIPFSGEDNGRKVTVELIPVYQSSVDITPDFYFGDRYDIMKHVFVREIPAILLSLIAIIIGTVYIFFILYNYKKSDVENNLLMLGYFAIQLGIWKLSDTESINLLFPGHPALSQLPFMALLLLCVPFVLFIRDLYSTGNSFVWNIPCIASFAAMILAIGLQYLGIADMRQLLSLTHLIMVMIIVISLIMAVVEVRNMGWSRKLKRNIWCAVICFLGAGMDMLIYYISRGTKTTVLGMVGFMTYIVVLGLSSMQEAKELIDIGMKAEQYERKAYHDQLTGLFNRTAYAEHTGRLDFIPDKCVVVMLDINNLKKCNDTLGHDKGDLYIRECAHMIRESFEDIGRCYRMGGDEFCVLLVNGNLQLCKQRVQLLKEKVEQCGEIGGGFCMGIACGYKMYDNLLDYDIQDTAKRADKMMYHEKFEMKLERK